MAPFQFGIVGDPGNTRVEGTSFYYSPGFPWTGGNTKIESLGPGQKTVADLVRSFGGTDLLNLGDLTYEIGASSVIDESNGQYYNNYMAPYPAPGFLADPYRQTPGSTIWPFDTYDYPNGYPNPATGGPGGSSDGVNRFWPTVGNHDYGGRIAYGETNVAEGNSTGTPAAPSSTATPMPFVDYFGWLADPSLLSQQSNLKVASADGTGQSGIYYSVELGEQSNGNPLIEVFSLDAQRLVMNAGGYYQLSNGFGPVDVESAPYNYAYDPSQPFVEGSNTAAALTSDPDNGQQQFQWLKNGLETSTAKWKIIMGHQPVYSSGQWGRTQPDDHMSTPVLQKLLNALPEGSFDAYQNGHSHYYQRVLEGNADGIGQGIPFITNGNSGRILYAINQTEYGDSVYSPSTPGLSQEVYEGEGSRGGSIAPFLLPSSPTTVGVSGAHFTTDTGLYTGKRTGFTSGAYGYGFGGQDAKADDGFLFFNYRQAEVLDPAITDNLNSATRNPSLEGWDVLNQADWRPEVSSTNTAAEVLALTAQFDITVGTDGTITQVSVRNGGRGYMASQGGNHSVDFEIRGHDSTTPAIVTLTFSGGVLSGASLKQSGAGYTFLAQANAKSNAPLSEPQVNTIAVNASLQESTYGVPYTDYQDWYLIADTSIEARSDSNGSFGTLAVDLSLVSDEAARILEEQPITTGYSGNGRQAKYATPQQGTIDVVDATGRSIGSGMISNGSAALQLNAVAAPGPVTVRFSGDHQSSYLTNFKASNAELSLSYGSWNSGITSGDSAFTLANSSPLSVTRTDQGSTPISFGVLAEGSDTPLILSRDADAASRMALTTERIFTSSGDNSWLATEGQAQGSRGTTGSNGLAAGTWLPFASIDGVSALLIESVSSFGNTIEVTFTNPVVGGAPITASYSTEGTGTAENLPGSGSITATVQRLGRDDHDLGFYPADPITGAINVNGTSYLPGDGNYLSAALELASEQGLLLSADQLPGYQGTATFGNLPLSAGVNYGLILSRGGSSSDLISSYAGANSAGIAQVRTFEADNRGVVYGIEDLRPGEMGYDQDFNDLIVTLSGADFSIL